MKVLPELFNLNEDEKATHVSDALHRAVYHADYIISAWCLL